VKAEYDYYDFGARSVTLVGTFAGAPISVPASKSGRGFRSES